MDKKLTLSLDRSIIEKAKSYAKANNISLSKLIESYLASLTKPSSPKDEISPLVKSLSGVITMDKDFDENEAYTDYLIEKYK
ncbi:DUF6364 family protein [Robertkochia sediminum]|uniref:DUF6364 family protein n=1 Tax=Robertkochia sediminum TaxID=2785326 RepID=UPI0019324075|nr:DUF6364 family protein [Robertkochia sediminum]MBL7473723.1 hypothetical protein [Robertkochia sediminum]